MPSEFKNEPFTDFSNPKNAKAMKDALAKVSSELGKEYDLIIGAKRKKTQDRIRSINPAQPDQVVGLSGKATSDDAEEALQVATEAFKTWSRVAPNERAEYLFKAADLMRKRKHEFSAWMVYEVGKSWAEADGDTAEAIDFLEFYGREMIRYGGEQPLTKIPTEKNELRYIPLGVGAVIPPWNFPVAIMVGMTSAAFVSGNTVLLKPSSDAPVVAAKFMEILDEIGLPPGVVNYVPGSGAQVGDYIVQQTGKKMILWPGYCPTHLKILPEDIVRRKHQHPQARVVVHPECHPDVIALADAALSTSGIIRYAARDDISELIVGTEVEILHRLRKENPVKKFIPASEKAICPNMKLITLAKILNSLETMSPRITVPEEIRTRAKAAVDRMLAIV